MDKVEEIPVANFIRQSLYTIACLMCRKSDRVFKADLWNESHPGEAFTVIPGKLFSVEVSYFRTLRAVCQPGQEKMMGNIRGLPFKDQVFDIVLDLSTIDHTTNPERTIKEYRRVLKMGGKALVASWVGNYNTSILTEIHLDQFIHKKSEFIGYLQKYFNTVNLSTILDKQASSQVWVGLDEGTDVEMIAFICE